VQSGLLTSTDKKRRGVLVQHYQTIRDALYQQQQQPIPSTTNSTETFSRTFLELLSQIMPHATPSPSASFAELGGDSLSAAYLLNKLNSQGIQLTMQQLYEYPLSHLAQLVENRNNNVLVSVVAAPLIHNSMNWDLEWHLPPSFPQRHVTSTPTPQKHIFMTGCTGFLGPVLLAEILRVYPSSVNIYCLIRGKSSESSLERLKRDMEKLACGMLHRRVYG
jgi:hypothetical protein